MPDRIITKDGYIVSSKLRIGLFYAYLIAIGILAYFVATTVLSNARIARESHRALCTLKVEREHRVAQTKDILDHPNKPNNEEIIRNFGMKIIVRSYATSKADLAALKDVSC